jgi:hypothetical protein
METTCQASYPLNSENESPFGTFTVYLSWAARASALRQYLSERGYLRAAGRFRITPARRGSGRHDVSQAHDRHLANQ